MKRPVLTTGKLRRVSNCSAASESAHIVPMYNYTLADLLDFPADLYRTNLASTVMLTWSTKCQNARSSEAYIHTGTR